MAQKITSQRNLFDSERRFRLLVEGVIDYAIYMLDPDGHHHQLERRRRAHQGLRGRRDHRPAFQLFYPPEGSRRGTAGAVAGNRAARTEIRGRRLAGPQGRHAVSRLGRDRPIYEDGELVGFAKITRDITERSGARAALRESERQFRLLVSGVTDYALYMLDPEGIVPSWNAGGERIKGYAPDEIIGQHFSRFYTEADRAAGRPARALRDRARERPLRGGRLARPQGRHRSSGPASSSIRSATTTAG